MLEYELEEALRERDDAEDFINELLDEVLGVDRPEWSSAYNRYDAMNDVRERITALHKPAADKAWGCDGLMALAAFRYCLGRMTYIVGDCEQWICANWEHFPPNVRKLIQREVEEEIKRDDEARADGRDYKPLGHDCDRAAWIRVRSLWKDKA